MKRSLTISAMPDGMGCVSALDREGRTIWIADAHRDDRKRFVVRADEKLTAFLELFHVLLSAQIKIGHATVWMRIRVCVSFILRPSLLPFGFALWFARILRETFTGLLTHIVARESVSLCAQMSCSLRCGTGISDSCLARQPSPLR
jgi:hypothetical protein